MSKENMQFTAALGKKGGLCEISFAELDKLLIEKWVPLIGTAIPPCNKNPQGGVLYVLQREKN